MPKKLGSLIWKLLVLLLFFSIAAATLFIAYGYRVDFESRDVTKTSIVDVTSKYKEVRVVFDGTQQSEVLPYQVKGVLPGNHELEIGKDGFYPWKRNLAVEEDIVTIVLDVLLVPNDLKPFIKKVASFADARQLIFGDDYLLSYTVGSPSISFYQLYPDGTLKNEELKLFKTGIANIRVIYGKSLLVFFQDGTGVWANFDDRRFQTFDLPIDPATVKVNGERRLFYFLKDGSLFAIPFDDLDTLKISHLSTSGDELRPYRILKNVEAFDIAFGNSLYYLYKGMLFTSDQLGKEARLLDYAPGKYANIAFKGARNYSAMVLRGKDGYRMLVLLDGHGHQKVLSKDLKGRLFFNGFDQLVYADGDGKVFFYDPNIDVKHLVAAFDGDFEIFGWFTSSGHFLVKQNGKLILTDVFHANTYPLLDPLAVDHLFVLDKTIFFLEKGTFFALNWQEL